MYIYLRKTVKRFGAFYTNQNLFIQIFGGPPPSSGKVSHLTNQNKIKIENAHSQAGLLRDLTENAHPSQCRQWEIKLSAKRTVAIMT